MQDGAILDICLRANSNLINVCPNDALKPNAGFGTDRDVPQNGGVRGDVNIVGDHRIGTEKPIEALQHVFKTHKNKINALTKSSEFCEKTNLAAFARDPAWILGSQAYDPTANASFIMNKVELVEAVQKLLGGETSKAESERAVTAVISAVKVGVKKDKMVQLVGFGTFKVVERKARKGVNPKTLQQIRIPKSKTVKFVPGKDFKSKV
jgi:DNA-binding protein HU-beta